MKPEDITLADAMTLRSAIQDMANQYKKAGFDIEESFSLVEGVFTSMGNTMIIPFAKLTIRRVFATDRPKRKRFLFGKESKANVDA